MSTVDADLNARIAERVRARRHARGWTLDEMAARSGVSRRMLVNIEQAATNPSIGTLLRVGEALGIGLPDLVAPGLTEKVFDVSPAGSRAPLWTGAHGGSAVLVAGAAVPDAFELWDWTLGPGDAHASEPHTSGTWELLSVLEGSVALAIGGEEVPLGVGDAVTFRGDVLHAYRNDGGTIARFSLAVHEPAAAPEGSR